MNSRAVSKKNLYVSLFFLFSLLLILAVFHLSPTTTSAEKKKVNSHIENYDIRLDKSAQKTIEKFISRSGKTDDQLSNFNALTRTAENELSDRFSDLVIQRNPALPIPEVISRKNIQVGNYLTSKSKLDRVRILRNFITQNRHLFGLDRSQIDDLKTTADYTNPNVVLSFVHLEQRFNDIPVFRGEIKAGFTKEDQLFRIINNLAPHIDESLLKVDFGSTKAAVRNAAKHINVELQLSDIVKLADAENGQKMIFDKSIFADQITAEKIYFPIESGVIVSAWRVLFWTRDSAFYVIVDSEDGSLLWRKNITEDQTETATYNIYGNLMSPLKTADSPSPFSPGCTDPNNCPDPPAIPRIDFTLVGNESPYDFNNLGWIPDGDNRTAGNNVEAGIDRDGTIGIDANGFAVGTPDRVFSYTYNPGPGNPSPGEEPVPSTQTYPPSQFQQGSITQAFYTVNRWHDETYLLGFTEAAFNFQDDNFGRGGIENDSIELLIQPNIGTNGANFSTPADGGRPRGQFFVFTAPDPDRDSALDGEIVVHEITHGLSNRLHGNTAGLGSNMSRGMGEGFSDFFALALLSEPSDAECGIYPIAGYVSDEIVPGVANYYYGIRRFPTAKISCLGPNGKPHNPLTFGDLNPGCDISDGAYPRGPIGSSTCDQVHNAGEIWTQMLWEVRALFIKEYGAVEGNRRVLQYVIDGMKLTPLNPTFIQERDAMIAAAAASEPDDVDIVRRGFAKRGMGASAEVISANPANVVESFEPFLNVELIEPFTFNEVTGNGNGFPEANETLEFSVTLSNQTGQTITNVTAEINGGDSVNFGDIPNNTNVTRQIVYTIPSGVECGSFHDINVNITSDIGSKTVVRKIRIGQPDAVATFESDLPINIPADQSGGSGPSDPYPSVINVSGLSGNKTMKVELTDLNHTWVGDVDILLEAPNGQTMVIMSDNFSASNRTGTVSTTLTLFDDALENMPSGGVPPSLGDFKPTNNGAADVFDAPAPSGPYGQPAPAGSATFASVFGANASNFNGEWKLWIDDDAGSDPGTMSGWKITFESYICFPCLTICTPPNGVRADFDGDGRTDISVYRPNEGNWYINQSLSGFNVVNWGISSDELVPNDYDGDGSTDFAVFRVNPDPSAADFYILNSSDFTFSGFSWGSPGDIPVIQDFDGDGKADVTIFRPLERVFYVLQSSSADVYLSPPMPNGMPLAGDFDGDGKGDFATYFNGVWFITNSGSNHQTSENYSFGLDTDKVVPADYDGDGRVDRAVYRPSNGTWYIQKSAGGVDIIQFGIDTDIPVPGDYDGDGIADIGVFRDGVWYINQSFAGVTIGQFGIAGDKPIPAEYLPR